MKLKSLLFAAVMALTATQARAEGGGFFSDTAFGVRDSMFASNVGGNPGSSTGSRNVNKVIFNANHFNTWEYGSFFFNGDVLLSNPNEAAYNSSGGSTEYYGVFRSQWSPDKIFGINTKFGPISAINFEVGGDLETENTQFAPNKKVIVAGPNFHFDLPGGFLNVGAHVYQEWNHNGFCTNGCKSGGGPITFDTTGEFEFVWMYPLKFTGLPLDFRGFMNITLPKGRNGFGDPTYTEILARPTLNLDVGTMLFNKPHKPDIFIAVELWQNKFGNGSKVAGSEQVAPTIGLEFHF